MKKLTFAVALTTTLLTAALQGAVVVTGATPNDSLIIGFNPPAPAQQEVVVAGPLPSGIGGGFGFNNNGVPLGFITMVDSNFVAIFTNQFGTNMVALPFAGTNLTQFAGRLPLGPLAPPSPIGATNSAPGPAPAVPPQTPMVNFPPATVSPAVPQPGGLPPIVSPLPPTGRLAPIIPPTGTPTPSPTPIPPNSTPIPPNSTPIPPQSTPVPPPAAPR